MPSQNSVRFPPPPRRPSLALYPPCAAVCFPPARRPWAGLLWPFAAVCWYVAGDSARLLYSGVWLPARAGAGLLDPVMGWYPKATASAVHSAHGLLLALGWLVLWMMLRPTRGHERWGLALSLPAIAIAIATMPLLTRVAAHGRSQAMAVLTATLRPTVDLAEQGAVPDAETLRRLAHSLRAALPSLAFAGDEKPIIVAWERPDADRAVTTLTVRYTSAWLAWDRASRAWRTSQQWR